MLAMHGCYVVCTSRSLEKGEEALKEMTDAGAPPENLMLMQVRLLLLAPYSMSQYSCVYEKVCHKTTSRVRLCA